MPPPAIRLIATIFLGLPGLALWLGGLIAIGMMAALITSTTTAHWEEVAIISVCGLLASIGGSAMIKGWRLFIQGNRHHLPIYRITLITAVAVAAQILAVIALSCLVPGAYQLLEIDRKEGMLPLAISGVSLLLSIFLQRHLARMEGGRAHRSPPAAPGIVGRGTLDSSPPANIGIRWQ